MASLAINTFFIILSGLKEHFLKTEGIALASCLQWKRGPISKGITAKRSRKRGRVYTRTSDHIITIPIRWYRYQTQVLGLIHLSKFWTNFLEQFSMPGPTQMTEEGQITQIQGKIIYITSLTNLLALISYVLKGVKAIAVLGPYMSTLGLHSSPTSQFNCQSPHWVLPYLLSVWIYMFVEISKYVPSS